MENCKIQGRSYSFPVTKTRDRDGWHQTGELLTGRRDRVDFVFENGKTAFLDFDEEQYFSPIRSRTWNIQGDRGEIRDWKVCYLNEGNDPVTEQLHREDFYPLREGLQDAYLNFVMEEELRTGEEKYTCRQSWAE